MGPMKPGSGGMVPMDKSNSMPYPSRYGGRKAWPMTRSIHGTQRPRLLIHSNVALSLSRQGWTWAR